MFREVARDFFDLIIVVNEGHPGHEHFGDPLFEYSLAQGTDDGFLAPYPVRARRTQSQCLRVGARAGRARAFPQETKTTSARPTPSNELSRCCHAPSRPRTTPASDRLAKRWAFRCADRRGSRHGPAKGDWVMVYCETWIYREKAGYEPGVDLIASPSKHWTDRSERSTRRLPTP
jgi:hypothetical protein